MIFSNGRHPYLPSCVTNIHIVQQLSDNVLAHGPIYGWWVFALERINGRIKNIKMSGRNMFQGQVVELRSLLRQRFALQRLNTLATSELEPAEKQLGEQLIEGYRKGGIDLGMDNDVSRPTQEVFRRFLNDYLSRVSGRSPAAPVLGSVIHHFEFHREIAVRGYRFRPLGPTFQ